jgi:hypothetical protein
VRPRYRKECDKRAVLAEEVLLPTTVSVGFDYHLGEKRSCRVELVQSLCFLRSMAIGAVLKLTAHQHGIEKIAAP